MDTHLHIVAPHSLQTNFEDLVAQSDWLMWQSSHMDWVSLANHFITTLQTYLAHFLFTEAQQATSKA